MTKEEIKALRHSLAKKMNDYIIDLGDEEIWLYWITLGVPDEPTEEDYEYFEEKENFDELVKLFDKCVKMDKENE